MAFGLVTVVAMNRPDDVDSLTYAIERLETALRRRRPSQEGRQAVLKIIETLKEMRERIVEQRARQKPH